MDSSVLNIISKLARLDHREQVHLQWIPSHAVLLGKKTADELAGRGCDLPEPSSSLEPFLNSFPLQS
ncbi:hypothetical protein TNCV_3678551 [Trichonephila clavipes]|nr:hypothetical protein TNCV_3678551 [Trichonephila clavipes]